MNRDSLFLTASPSVRKVEETPVTPRVIAHERREIAEILRSFTHELDPKDLPGVINKLADQLVFCPPDRPISMILLLAEGKK